MLDYRNTIQELFVVQPLHWKQCSRHCLLTGPEDTRLSSGRWSSLCPWEPSLQSGAHLSSLSILHSDYTQNSSSQQTRKNWTWSWLWFLESSKSLRTGIRGRRHLCRVQSTGAYIHRLPHPRLATSPKKSSRRRQILKYYWFIHLKMNHFRAAVVVWGNSPFLHCN